MNSITYGSISKVLSEITTDVSNNIGKHNTFVVVTNSENHYPERIDPIILRYDQTIEEWILVSDKTIENFGYLKETIDITNNGVLLEKAPLDKVIWDVFITNENGNIIKTLTPKELVLDVNLLSGLKDYIGQTLSLMYAFGDVNGNATIIKKDLPTTSTYYNQEASILKYDGPYDMNDILVEITYPNTNSYFDQVILKRVKEIEKAIKLVNTRKLYTTKRILIENNKIILPFKPIGTIVHDMAIIYENDDIVNNLVIMEVTCEVHGDNVVFDELDDLNGKYAKVTYIAELGTIVE